ncbi:IS30 family transposase, partial [Christensenellaceae bacterium OttesenSCG-928-K19]|nr:IS30 family transposase [Christensenellaceae bacterium OttesenSCG-928-K19]MDL2238131.1 IS30 family transposase [Christensenellaceae bacterium OttesenSCG-928-K19]
MSHYKHLSMEEREKILLLYTEKQSLRRISNELGRAVSTISREIKRNTIIRRDYSAVDAQRQYHQRRKKCRRHNLLENQELRNKVLKLFLEQQWSPEEISNRLAYESSPHKISYSTIYRGIYAGMLETTKLAHGNRGVIRKLRHRGKTRHPKGKPETRGKIVISNRIHERPKEADSRKTIGHWEVDTLAGKTGSACLVTITDRCSRYLLAAKAAKKCSEPVTKKMIALLSTLPDGYLRTITPDRGKEFAKHRLVTAEFGVQFYFPDPHAPWQRGTIENTNGLIREYLPKSFDISGCSDADIA